MPVTFLDRIPLPNLKIYSVLSVILLSVSVYHAVNVTSDPGWKVNATLSETGEEIKASDLTILLQTAGNSEFSNETRTFAKQMADVASFMIQEPFCIWTLINMSYCCLFLLGRSVQRVVFGELRVSERQHVKDKFWNFVFYKFIFVFGVINVQYMDEVVLWVAWFTALGFLHLLTQVCKDRFEYLSLSASSGGWAGARLAALLGTILALDGLLMILCVAVALLGGGLNTFAFMSAECCLLSICTMHVIFRYGLHVVESRHPPAEEALPLGEPSAAPAAARDRRAPLAHYAELAFELAALAVDLLHHLHMLVWSNIFLSMASLVICMQLRFLFHELQRRVRKHRNYVWVLNHMERNYPMATNEELAENSDNCAICWEKMDTARKLPCGHLFHNSCLSSWLQQDTSCPTCRLGLSLWPSRASQPPSQSRQPNHFFHFDGSRYVSWLPSFSVEVTHIMRAEILPATNSQMDAMARQVQQLFPHFPLSVIVRDLTVTHSVELTVENILDARLVMPTRHVPHDQPTALPALPGLLLTTRVGSTRAGTSPLLARAATSPLLSRAAANPQSQVLLQHSLSMLANQLGSRQGHVENMDWNVEPQESNEDHATVGGRFSKCSYERERILQTRKEKLISSARKKYLEKKQLAASKQQEAESRQTAEDNSAPSNSRQDSPTATKPNSLPISDSLVT